MRSFFRPWAESRTYTTLFYLLLALPLGILYFVFLVTALSVGLGTVVIWVGVPLLVAALIAWRALAVFDRAVGVALLGADVEPPPPVVPPADTLWGRLKALLTDSFTWRSVVWLLLRFPLGVASFVITVVWPSVALSFLAAPFTRFYADTDVDGQRLGDVDIGDGRTLDSLINDTALMVVVAVVGVVLVLLYPHILRGLGWVHRKGTEALLGPSARARAAELEQRTTELEERARLARELHDSVGHTITATTLQAGAAGHVFDKDPEFARQALADIEAGGRRALEELDRVLGLLREEDAEASERAPAPTLGDLDRLVDETRRAGIPVDLHVRGPVDRVGRELGTTVYRVVQEALTNVMKHAGRVGATVTVAVGDGDVRVTVQNAAPPSAPPAPPRSGRGLVGLRERVGAYGGSVSANPDAAGGFTVEAVLPLAGT